MPDTGTSVKQPAPPIDPTTEAAKIEPGDDGPIKPNDGPNSTKGTEEGAPRTPGEQPPTH